MDYNWPSELTSNDDEISYEILRRISLFELRHQDQSLHRSMFVDPKQSDPVYAIGCFIPRPGSPSSYSKQPYLWAKFKIDFYSLDFGQLTQNDPNRGLWFKCKSVWYKPEIPSPVYQSIAEKELAIVERCLEIRESILKNESYYTKIGDMYSFNVRIDEISEFANEESLEFIAANADVLLNMLARDLYDNDKLKRSIKNLAKQLSSKANLQPAKSSSAPSSSIIRSSLSTSTSSASLNSEKISSKSAVSTSSIEGSKNLVDKSYTLQKLDRTDSVMDSESTDVIDAVKPRSKSSLLLMAAKPTSSSKTRLFPKSESASEIKKRLVKSANKTQRSEDAIPTAAVSESSNIPPTENRIKKKKVDDEDENLTYADISVFDKARAIALGRDKIGSKTPRDHQREKIRYIPGSKPTSTIPSTKFVPGASAATILPSYNINRPPAARTSSTGSSIDSPSHANMSPSVDPYSASWTQTVDTEMLTSPALMSEPEPSDNWQRDESSSTYLNSPNAYESLDVQKEIHEAIDEYTYANTEANKRNTTTHPEKFGSERKDLMNAHFQNFYSNIDEAVPTNVSNKRVVITDILIKYSPVRETKEDTME